MGRLTEFLYFLEQDDIDKEDEMLYTHLTITDELKDFKNKINTERKSNLKLNDGVFELF